ncbi:hypothetical protein PG987_001756 [Apiospora arundinis]
MSSPAYGSAEEAERYKQLNDRREDLCEIIERDDAAAFSEFIHAWPDFINHRSTPFSTMNWDGRVWGTTWEVAMQCGSTGVLGVLLDRYDDIEDDAVSCSVLSACTPCKGWDGQWYPSPRYRYLLHRAIEERQIGVLRFLLARPQTDIHQRDIAGWTPLLWACHQLCYNGPGGDDETPLDVLIDQHEEMIDMLLAAGANPHDELRHNPKRNFDTYGDTEENDEDADAVSQDDYVLDDTTLSLIVPRARAPLLRRLIEEEGVDVQAPVLASWKLRRGVPARGPGDGASPRLGRGGLAPPLGGPGARRASPVPNATPGRRRTDVSRHRNPAGAPAAHRRPDRRARARGKTALALAAGFRENLFAGFDATCYDPVVRFLLEKGADARDAVDDEGNTPLHAALDATLGARGNKVATVSLLLSYGARADAVNHMGDTPVHIAAGMHAYLGDCEDLQRTVDQNQQKIMQLLLRSLGGKGTEILDQPNKDGKTPWQIERFTTSETPRLLKEGRAFAQWLKNRKPPYDWSIPVREQFIRDTKRACGKRRRRVRNDNRK